jgi:pSer/pThr/pTyr-binding forkhead associated (FHA) protein
VISQPTCAFCGRENEPASRFCESGDWIFPYDQTMSGRHAEVRSQDADFYVHDAGSRNGVALAVRGERAVKAGQRILLGDRILRIESVTT